LAEIELGRAGIGFKKMRESGILHLLSVEFEICVLFQAALRFFY